MSRLFIGMHGSLNLVSDSPRTPPGIFSVGSLRIFNQMALKWKSLEHVSDPYTFDMAPLARFLADARAAGITDFLYVLSGIPEDLSPGDVDFRPRLTAFIDALVPVLLPHAANIQFFNEPDGGAPFWPGGDVETFAAAISALPQRWTEATGRRAIGPCVTANGIAWLRDLVALDALPPAYIRAYAVNAYVAPNEPEAFLDIITPFRSLADANGVALWNTEMTQNSFRVEPGGAVSTHPTMMSDSQAAAYVWRYLLAAARAGVERLYWFGPDEDFSAVAYGAIGLLDPVSRTLLPPGQAFAFALSTLTGSKLTDWAEADGLLRVTIRRAGRAGAIYWCKDGQSGTVDLSSNGAGYDMFGAPLALSDSVVVTQPIVVWA